MVNSGMRIAGLGAGSLLALLAIVMIGEGITTLLGNPSFILVNDMNRGFELLMGLIAGAVAGIIINLSLM